MKTKILYIYRFTYIATLGCNPSTDINSFRLRIDGKISNSCTEVNYINANHKQTNLSESRDEVTCCNLRQDTFAVATYYCQVMGGNYGNK